MPTGSSNRQNVDPALSATTTTSSMTNSSLNTRKSNTISYKKKASRKNRNRRKSPNHDHDYSRDSSRSRDDENDDFNNNNNNNNNQNDSRRDPVGGAGLPPSQPSHRQRQPTTIRSARYKLFRRLTCYTIVICVGFVIVVSNNLNYIQFNTHQQGKITAKLDDVVVYPLKPHVQNILGVDHYYMMPYDINPMDYRSVGGGGTAKDSPTQAENNGKNGNNELSDSQITASSTTGNSQSIGEKFSNLKNKYYPMTRSSPSNPNISENAISDVQPNKSQQLQVKPKGILIFLHSCERSGLDFFYLPEERRIAYDALSKGLAVLGLTSQHRDSGCWTQPDVGWIGNVVDEWIETHGLEEENRYFRDSNDGDDNDNEYDNVSVDATSTTNSPPVGIPRIGVAVSSAASFLFFVYQSLQLRSMAIINSPQSYDVSEIESKLAIPTAYVSMPRDANIAKQMQTNHESLVKGEIPTQLYKVRPIPFTYNLCLGRLPELGESLCRKLTTTIQNDFPSLLDADGFIKEHIKPSSFLDKNNVWYQLFRSVGLDEDDNVSDRGINMHKSKHNYRTLRKRTRTKRIGTKGSPAPDNAVHENYHDKDDHKEEYSHLTKTAHTGHSWLWAAAQEEISTCYAYHAMTAEHHGAVLEFLMQEAGII